MDIRHRHHSIKNAQENWHEEKTSAFLYRCLAQDEAGTPKEQLFLNLANAAEIQAQIWAQTLAERNIPLPSYQPDIRTKFVAQLIKYLGARRIKTVLASMKVRGLSVYTNGFYGISSEPMTPYEDLSNKPTTQLNPLSEKRHAALGTSGSIRAAVFGINDGLVSNTSLILGIAGATSNTSIILLSGIAGLAAGAFSMAAGEYISMRSQKELFEYQIALERDELEQYPEEEQKELSYIYQARGLSKADADHFAAKILANKEHALNTLAREELGLNPEELGSPWGAAGASFAAFSVGALIPLMPFLINMGQSSALNLFLSIFCTGAALFLVVVILSLYTGRHAILSGLRMLAIGSLAGITTFLIGRFVGVQV